ncbi:lamin tail domain-containing protein [Solirubrobacter phytolaccae]|uniref:Lamin tail domain-containing protein n=1 Tax=Solirubrobacter phytolaccae TaxID=1404360 RepID=A0A9X3N9W6_9ACTN|nr:lamin tail domain-containing protein [Solirubrobacter phytolaccae]MDA0182204.1 lamin tail domain-containing protein [Solirubrobacter phytolaccae]
MSSWSATVATLAAAAVCGLGAATAQAAIVINEVESEGTADFIELKNTGAATDIGGWVLKDSNNGNTFTVPAGTTLPAGGYFVAFPGFGLGSSDQARLFTPADLVTPIDSYTWTEHAITTYGRCPDGTGAFSWTNRPTQGAANDCPAPAATWPGGVSIADADDLAVFSSNLSGIAYQPGANGARGVLWAVQNGPSTLYRLVHDGSKWVRDTAGGWGFGKQLVYPSGLGVPDAEGITLVASDPNAVYVSTERNDSGGDSTISRPAVLRYDTTGAGTTLTATNDWNLTADLPGLDANSGLEAIAWVPDTLLVSKGFVDESTGGKYDPAAYPGHGSGLFFVGVEQDGKVIAYALTTAGAYRRIATIASGFPAVMALEYEPETTHLWAACDNSCDGRTATLDIDGTGRFVVTNTFARPAGMSNLNNEGFAIAPQSECVAGFKPVFYTDDSGSGGHAIRTGTLTCTVPSPDPDPTPTPTPQPTTPTPTPTPTPPAPVVDRTAPSLKLALRVTKTGSFAVRRTGKLQVTLTLGERADLTFTATARKNSKARARSIYKSTRKGVKAGTTKLTVTLTKRVRTALRKGETVTLTLQARDAAGNAVTKRASVKVP